MKMKVAFEFDSIEELIAFNRDIYIKEGYHKRQWDIPTQVKINGRYAIKYCVGYVDKMKLIKAREYFRVYDKIESLV